MLHSFPPRSRRFAAAWPLVRRVGHHRRRQYIVTYVLGVTVCTYVTNVTVYRPRPGYSPRSLDTEAWAAVVAGGGRRRW